MPGCVLTSRQTSLPVPRFVVAKVGAAHAAAAERMMGSQRKSSDLLVNIW